MTEFSHHTAPEDNPAPLVTVIVPVYNAEQYLEECLSSIAAQTYRNLEIIIVNDGSTDSSASICRRFAERDRRFTLTEISNQGVSAARNVGIDKASGKYVCFVDADDTIHPAYVERLAAAMAGNDAQVAIARYYYGNDSSRLADMKTAPEIFAPEEITEKGLYQRICVNAAGGTMVDRHIFDSGIRYNQGRRYEDLDIFYKFLLSAEKVAYIPDKLYFYRHNDNSFLNTYSEGRIDALDVTDDMLAYMEKNAPTLVPAARDRRFSANFNVLLMLLKYKQNRPEIMRRCIDTIRSERWNELANPKVKIKNKIGALASFGGVRFLKLLNRII